MSDSRILIPGKIPHINKLLVDLYDKPELLFFGQNQSRWYVNKGSQVLDGTDFRNGGNLRFKSDLSESVPCGGWLV